MSTRRGFLGTAGAVGVMALLDGADAAASAADGPGSGPEAAARELRARNAVLAVDTATQQRYDALRGALIEHLSPVIVVQNDDRGGLFTLVHRGSRESAHPVSAIFELAKSVAHAPLGVYSIVAPYLARRIPDLPGAARPDRHDLDMVAFKGPRAKGWVGPLRAFGATLSTARRQLGEARLPQELAASSARILDAAVAFAEQAVRRGSFDMASFEDFTGSLDGPIATNLAYAARAQIDGVSGLMKRWRAEVGEEEWPGLYVVVLSIWTTSAPNQNSLIVKRFLDPAGADSHLIDLPTAQLPGDPVLVALDNLARIVQDDVAAEMVFPTDRKLADALKGPEDLLAPAIRRGLACPYRSPAAVPHGSGGP